MIKKVISNLSIVSVLLLAILFYSCGQKEASEHLKSAMFMNNTMHTGKFDSPSVKNQPHLLWKFKTDGQVLSSPVIAGDMLYIGSTDNTLYAINSKTGEIKWDYKTNGSINSTPLVANGRVLFLSYDGLFYALNENDGKLLWKFKTGGESVFKVKDYYNGSFQPDFWDFYLSSAVEKNGVVYFGSSDSNIYALDIATGKKIWNYKTAGSIHSSPAIHKNDLVIGSWDSNVYCIDITTGKEKWTFATGKDIEQYIWLGVQASPSIDSGVVYIGSRDAKFYALNIKTGDTLWTKDEFDKSWMPSSAAIDKDNIYTGSSDSFSFFSINKKTGHINYATKTNAYSFSSPAIDNDMAYIGSGNGRLFGISLNDGGIKWEFKTIGCETDTINLFDAKGKMDFEKSKVLTTGITDMPSLNKVFGDALVSAGAIFSSPVISNQTVYFGSSDGYIYAITDKIVNK